MFVYQSLAATTPHGRVLHFHIYVDTEEPEPSPVTTTLTSSISARKRRKAAAANTDTTPPPLAFDELPGIHLRPPAGDGRGTIPAYYEAELAEGGGNGTQPLLIFVRPNGDPSRAFHCMVSADVLVLSPSQMSYVMAWVTKAVVVYPFFKLKVAETG